MGARTQRGSAEGIAALIGLAFVASLVALNMWVSSVRCQNRWANSGMASSWAVAQGCIVRLPDGRWIPDDRVRDIGTTSAPAMPQIPTKAAP